MFRRGWSIVIAGCSTEGISLEELQSGRRTKTIARVRREITLRLREETDLSWAEIAAMVGRKSSFRLRKHE